MNHTQSYIDRWCEKQYPSHLQLLKTLAAIPAPSHHEEKRAEFIKNWLIEQGAKDVYIDEAKNVVLALGDDGTTPFRVIMAHTDIVFPDTTPLPVKEENGLLFAPGIGDDTANVVALMLCVTFFLSEKISPASPLLIVFNSCEEGLGNLKGVRQIVSRYSGRIRELVSFDCGYDWLVTRAVGSERWQIQVSTIGGHSYGDFGNPNAIAHLSALVCNLYEQPVPHKANCTTTFNVGTISGGTSVNTIAQDAAITYEYRSDDRECLAIMAKQFQECVNKMDSQQARITIQELGVRPCGENVPEKAQAELLER